MHNKARDKKTGTASYNAILAGVTKEMAQPRVAESAQLTADEQSKKESGKPTSHRGAGRAAKRHIEEYGTGTLVEETP